MLRLADKATSNQISSTEKRRVEDFKVYTQGFSGPLPDSPFSSDQLSSKVLKGKTLTFGVGTEQGSPAMTMFSPELRQIQRKKEDNDLNSTNLSPDKSGKLRKVSLKSAKAGLLRLHSFCSSGADSISSPSKDKTNNNRSWKDSSQNSSVDLIPDLNLFRVDNFHVDNHANISDEIFPKYEKKRYLNVPEKESGEFQPVKQIAEESFGTPSWHRSEKDSIGQMRLDEKTHTIMERTTEDDSSISSAINKDTTLHSPRPDDKQTTRRASSVSRTLKNADNTTLTQKSISVKKSTTPHLYVNSSNGPQPKSASNKLPTEHPVTSHRPSSMPFVIILLSVSIGLIVIELLNSFTKSQ